MRLLFHVRKDYLEWAWRVYKSKQYSFTHKFVLFCRLGIVGGLNSGLILYCICLREKHLRPNMFTKKFLKQWNLVFFSACDKTKITMFVISWWQRFSAKSSESRDISHRRYLLTTQTCRADPEPKIMLDQNAMLQFSLIHSQLNHTHPRTHLIVSKWQKKEAKPMDQEVQK